MFSELVDAVVDRIKRPSQKADIANYINSTIRECNTLRYFDLTMIEAQTTATASPHILNNPAHLRTMLTINYNNLVFPRHIKPGRKQLETDYYYYAATTYYVLAGCNQGDTINYAYYKNPPPLKYYTDDAGDKRPAVYDYPTATWQYWDSDTEALVSTLGDDALDEAARDSVGNWLLQEWRHVIEEGAVSKYFNIKEDPRGPKTYALYKSLQSDIEKNVAHSALDA